MAALAPLAAILSSAVGLVSGSTPLETLLLSAISDAVPPAAYTCGVRAAQAIDAACARLEASVRSA